MEKLSYTQLLQLRLTAEQLKTVERFPVSVILDNVRSLYNVGSMFRTADACRITELVLTGYTPAPPRKEISKTALGAEETVPWIYLPTAKDAVLRANNMGHTTVAIELTDDAISIEEVVSLSYPLTLVLGNELTGITKEALDLCTTSAVIPMFGIKHSLNVAVAAGIAMYSAVSGAALNKS